MKHMVVRLGAIGTSIGMASIIIASGVASAAPRVHVSPQLANTLMNMSQSTQGNGNSQGSSTTSAQQDNQGNGKNNGNQGNNDKNKQNMHIQIGKILSALGLGSGGSITLNSKSINFLKGLIASIKTNWPTTNTNPNWTPSGANWQLNWRNWNPALWEANGSSFANWSTQLDSFLDTMFPSLAGPLSTIDL